MLPLHVCSNNPIPASLHIELMGGLCAAVKKEVQKAQRDMNMLCLLFISICGVMEGSDRMVQQPARGSYPTKSVGYTVARGSYPIIPQDYTVAGTCGRTVTQKLLSLLLMHKNC